MLTSGVDKHRNCGVHCRGRDSITPIAEQDNCSWSHPLQLSRYGLILTGDSRMTADFLRIRYHQWSYHAIYVEP